MSPTRTSRASSAGSPACLGDAGVNIATFALGRDEPGGSAIALVSIDGAAPSGGFGESQQNQGCSPGRRFAVLISARRAESREICEPGLGARQWTHKLEAEGRLMGDDCGEPAPPIEPDKGSGVSPRLLEILVCPVTRAELTYDAARQELVSRAARLAYPIRDGVPIMLPEEARKLDD